MRYPSISIIIPTYNRRDSLRLCLLSLGNQNIDTESMDVIVVDNLSTDGTREMLSSLALPFRLHLVEETKKNRFESSRLRNCGIRRAKGDILFFLDSDMLVPRSYIQQHLTFYRDSTAIAVLGKMLYLASNDRLTDRIGIDPWEPEDLGTVQLAGNTVNRFLEFSGNLPQYKRPWDFCIGANFSIARQCTHLAGIFDESLDGEHPAAADCAYGLQMFSAGVRLVYGRAAIGVHQHNHPILLREDPEYFRERQESVWEHEDEVHRKWLASADADATMDHILRKRAANELVNAAKAAYTMQIEVGPLCRLTPRLTASQPLMLSLFLIHDGTPEQLRMALSWLENNEPVPDLFEVIVLDTEASVNEKASDYNSAANAEVQLFRARYTLRYFATGTRQQDILMKELAGSPVDDSPTPLASAATATRNLVQTAYQQRLRVLLSEKPLAPVSITAKTSNFQISPDFLSSLGGKLRAVMGV